MFRARTTQTTRITFTTLESAYTENTYSARGMHNNGGKRQPRKGTHHDEMAGLAGYPPLEHRTRSSAVAYPFIACLPHTHYIHSLLNQFNK